MKNAMKKIMSLMLVAVLLVSVLPMNAMALTDLTGGEQSSQDTKVDSIDSMVDGSSRDAGEEAKQEEVPANDKIRSMTPEEGKGESNVEDAPEWEVSFFTTAGAQIGEKAVYTLEASSWDEVKTPKQLLNALFIGWADDWTFDSVKVEDKTYNSETTKLGIASGNKVSIYLEYIPSYPVHVRFIQTQSNQEMAKVELGNKRSISMAQIIDAIPESLNASTTVTEAHFETNSKKIVTGNAYDLSEHVNSKGKVWITAMLDATDLDQYERPTLGNGSDVTNDNTVTEEDYVYVTFIEADGTVVRKKVDVGTSGATINEILNFYGYNTNEFLSAATRARQSYGLNSLIYNGSDITITLKNPNNNNNNDDDDYNGSYSDGDTYYGSSNGVNNPKFKYDIVLNVFLNNQVGSVHRDFEIQNGIALDGTVTLAEVESLLKNYYTAKDSSGLNVDGIYLASGNWVSSFSNDYDKYSRLERLDEESKRHEVNLIVMLTNANVKNTTSTSTSDNPKTGDSIMMTVSVLGVSAAALAVLFFYNKKRAF